MQVGLGVRGVKPVNKVLFSVWGGDIPFLPNVTQVRPYVFSVFILRGGNLGT